MPAQAAARQSMEPEPRVSIVLAPPKGLELLNEDSTGFMIAPLRTALHVHEWNLAALLSGQGHGKDSKLQPGGCENQDDEEGPAPARHGGPQQGRSQKRPRQGCVLQSAGRGPRVGPALPAESTPTPQR